VLTFQNRPGGATVYPYSKPGSRVKSHAIPTAEQELIRGYYQEAVIAWQALDAEQKIEWDLFVKGLLRKYGYALSFDRLDDYVNCGTDTSLQIPDTWKFNVEVRFKVEGVAAGSYDVILGKEGPNNATDFEYLLWLSNADSDGKFHIVFGITDNGNGGHPAYRMFMETVDAIEDSDYHYLSVAVDLNLATTDKVKFFLDGEQKTSTLSTGSYITHAYQALNSFRIGQTERLTGDRTFDGRIDQIRISDTDRTLAEAIANWNGGAGRRFEKDAHTLALWHMDEGEGDKIYDKTDNHNDGDILGASWVDGHTLPLCGVVNSTPPHVNVSPDTYDGYRAFISQYVKSRISG